MAVIVRQNGVLVDNAADDIDFVNGLTVTQLTPGVVQINIGDLAIITSMIADGAVTTPKIADGSVTPNKLDRAYWQLAVPSTRPPLSGISTIMDGSVITNVANVTTSSFGGGSILVIPNDANYSVEAEISVVCQQSTNGNTCAVSMDVATDAGFVNKIISTGEILTKRADYLTINVYGFAANRRNETLYIRANVRSAGGSNSQVQSIFARVRAFPQS